jgi:hypothetical protein
MSSGTGDQANRRNPFAMAQAGWADAMASVSVAAEGACQAHLHAAEAAYAAVAEHSEGDRATIAIIEALRNAEALRRCRERLQHIPAGAGIQVFYSQLVQALAGVKWVYSRQCQAMRRSSSAAEQVGPTQFAVIRDAVQALSTEPPRRFMPAAVIQATLKACLALRRYKSAVSQAFPRAYSLLDTISALVRELKSVLGLFSRLEEAAEQVTPLSGAPSISLTDGINASVSLQRALAAAKAASQEFETAEQQAFQAASALSLAFAAAAAGYEEEGGDDDGNFDSEDATS